MDMKWAQWIAVLGYDMNRACCDKVYRVAHRRFAMRNFWWFFLKACLGGCCEVLQAEVDFVTELATLEGGESGEYFWVFSPP